MVELLVARCAGLDVAKDEVVACVRVPAGRGGRQQEVRTFPTFTSGLEALAGWLAAEGVTQVVMEATGQYWKPIVRHEAPRVRAEVKGLRLRPVAAGR
jgi:transposase